MADKSPVIEEARRFVQSILDRIDRDECSEEELLHFIERTNAHTNGYYREEDFVNYDKAQKMLHIGDRTKMKAFLDRNRVKMHKFNNMPVGFLRSEVEALKTKAMKLFGKKSKHNTQ